jgi:hypothetical protein
MTKGMVASLRGDWAALVQAVNAVFGDKEFILLAEDASALNSLRFERKTALKTDTQHPRGRAFNKQREIRWRESAGGRFIITYLAEEKDGPPEKAGFSDFDTDWETRETRQKLYGKWNDKLEDWVEVSAPGISGNYKAVCSIAPTPFALQLDAVDYSRNGIVQMTRFRAVEACPE